MTGVVIAICDDELIFVQKMKSIIKEYLDEIEVEGKILSFTSGEKLLEEIEELNILFLDIEMPKMDGIEVGKRISRKFKNCKIIMATSRIERFKEAFKIEAFRFITKPFDKIELQEALQDALKAMVGMEELELYQDRIVCKIPQREIQHITSYGSFVEVSIGEKRLRKESSLSKMEKILDKAIFYRINRENIINIGYIDNYKEGKIMMGGQSFKVSRRRKKEFEKVFMEFDLKYR